MNDRNPSSESVAAQLNRTCFCMTLDDDALAAALREESGDPAFFETLLAARPHLFSHAPVFLPKADREAMQATVRAIEAATELAGYRDAVLAWAPAIAAIDHGPRGAFMGYDFHLADAGPRLIEINTNAGGAFLNAWLARAQIACCPEVERELSRVTLDDFESAVVSMFAEEWRRQGRSQAPRRIAIVDDSPGEQYLYPEFLVAKRLLERRGIAAVIVDGRALQRAGGALHAEGAAVDLVYNRLVDFALAEAEHASLRTAYVEGAVVLTPNPRNHALFADKRNLTVLSDRASLASWGLAAEHLAALESLPHTVEVTAERAPELWRERKRLFFKPASGHGGKAVYRGDKLTKGVWADILAHAYVAQELAPPSERTIELDGARVQRKLDVRLYTYAGRPLLAAARLYQGQTTNFRTPGGGFAPVFFV